MRDNNKIKESAQSGRTVINLLKNHSFEYDDGTWTAYKKEDIAKDKASNYTSGKPYIGPRSAYFYFSGTEGQVLGVKESRPDTFIPIPWWEKLIWQYVGTDWMLRVSR